MMNHYNINEGYGFLKGQSSININKTSLGTPRKAESGSLKPKNTTKFKQKESRSRLIDKNINRLGYTQIEGDIKAKYGEDFFLNKEKEFIQLNPKVKNIPKDKIKEELIQQVFKKDGEIRNKYNQNLLKIYDQFHSEPAQEPLNEDVRNVVKLIKLVNLKKKY